MSPFELTIRKGDKNGIVNELVLLRMVAYIYVLAIIVMIDLTNIRNFTIDRPGSWTLFGSPEDFDNFPEQHREQILFLNKASGKYIYDFVASAKLLTGDLWEPFAKGNFKTVEQFSDFSGTAESKQALKKWLFNRAIPFKAWVFVLPNYNDYPILTTWKMIIKYSGNLFFADDITIFDNSLNWCLFFYHEGHLFFGRDNVFDPSDDYKKMEEMNERKKNFPQFKHPYL